MNVTSGFSTTPRSLRRLAGCSFLLFGLLVGCGSGPAKDAPETVDVSGRVTLDGEALPNASVTFLPETPDSKLRAANGTTGSGGKYSLDLSASQSGIPPGQYKVVISTTQTNEDGDVVSPETLPAVYNRQTELMAAVSKEKKSFDWDLKSNAGPVAEPDPQE